MVAIRDFLLSYRSSCRKASPAPEAPDLRASVPAPPRRATVKWKRAEVWCVSASVQSGCSKKTIDFICKCVYIYIYIYIYVEDFVSLWNMSGLTGHCMCLCGTLSNIIDMYIPSSSQWLKRWVHWNLANQGEPLSIAKIWRFSLLGLGCASVNTPIQPLHRSLCLRRYAETPVAVLCRYADRGVYANTPIAVFTVRLRCPMANPK